MLFRLITLIFQTCEALLKLRFNFSSLCKREGTRVIDVIYKDEDGYTHAEIVLKDFVASLLVDPVPS
jgi:hypothetical protein